MELIHVFDSETTGFIKPELPDDHPSQPHLVQLGSALLTADGVEVASASLLVKPDGWSIPPGATAAHGITTEKALACGVPLAVAMSVFLNMRHQATELVAHNKPFDDKVMAVQIARLGIKPTKPAPAKSTCTMTLATPIVQLPPTAKMLRAGFNKFKAPSLTECIKFFFDEDFVGAHDAMIDVRGCARVYFEIMRLQREKAKAQEAAIEMTKEEEPAL